MTDPTQPPDEASRPADPTPEHDAYGAYEPAEPAAPQRSRRGLLIGSLAAVLAVVAGAAVWATTALSGGGRQPDEVVPKSTFAYVKVDLDPAANQKLAAREFFSKIPELRDNATDEDNVFEDVISDLVSDDDVDYDKDIKPWFDKRAAVAAFPGTGKTPNYVVALRSKDDGEARAALDRELAESRADGEDVEYRIHKGYVIIGPKASVEAAVQQTAEESLRDNTTYREDVDRLDGDQVIVAWADVAQVFDAVKEAVPMFGLLPNATTDQLKGRYVAGLHLTGEYAEVQGLVLGAPPETAAPGGDHALLRGLPADTMAAFSGVGALDSLTADKENLALLDTMIGQYLQGSGLSFTGDVLPLLGEELVVATGDFAEGGPAIGLLSKVADAARARAAGAKIASLLEVFDIPVKTDVEGDTFVMAMPAEFADTLLKGGGSLGTAPRFTQAMGDLTGSVFAVYVDIPAVTEAIAGEEEDTGLTAAGLVAGYRGNEGFFRLRLVAG